MRCFGSFPAKTPVLAKEIIQDIIFSLLHCNLALLHRRLMTALASLHMLKNKDENVRITDTLVQQP